MSVFVFCWRFRFSLLQSAGARPGCAGRARGGPLGGGGRGEGGARPPPGGPLWERGSGVLERCVVEGSGGSDHDAKTCKGKVLFSIRIFVSVESKPGSFSGKDRKGGDPSN